MVIDQSVLTTKLDYVLHLEYPMLRLILCLWRTSTAVGSVLQASAAGSSVIRVMKGVLRTFMCSTAAMVTAESRAELRDGRSEIRSNIRRQLLTILVAGSGLGG